jgi:hypothetical protein
MSKEVIEIRDTYPDVDEQIARILKPKSKIRYGAWADIIEQTEHIKVVARDGYVPNARRFCYPMFDDIKVEMKTRCLIEPRVTEALSQRIEHQMLRRNKSESILICETRERVSQSKRKDKSCTAPETTSKVIIPSLNEIELCVSKVVQRINSLGRRIPIDGILIRFRLGTINTLEFISVAGEDDEFDGF